MAPNVAGGPPSGGGTLKCDRGITDLEKNFF